MGDPPAKGKEFFPKGSVAFAGVGLSLAAILLLARKGKACSLEHSPPSSSL